jgi:hypothetical protein
MRSWEHNCARFARRGLSRAEFGPGDLYRVCEKPLLPFALFLFLYLPAGILVGLVYIWGGWLAIIGGPLLILLGWVGLCVLAAVFPKPARAEGASNPNIESGRISRTN